MSKTGSHCFGEKHRCPLCRKLLSFIDFNLFGCSNCGLEFAHITEGLREKKGLYLYIGRFKIHSDDPYILVKGLSKKELENYSKMILNSRRK